MKSQLRRADKKSQEHEGTAKEGLIAWGREGHSPGQLENLQCVKVA